MIAAIVVAAMAASLVLIALGPLTQARFLAVAYLLVDPLVALYSTIAAWQLLRNRQWLLGGLVALLALVMGGWSIEAVRAMQGLIG